MTEYLISREPAILLQNESSAANRDFHHDGANRKLGVVGGFRNQGACFMMCRSLTGIAATRQIFGRRLGAAAAAGRHTQLSLEIGQGVGTLGYGRLNLPFSDGVTDTNEHENNYHPI